ncbi:MAG: PDZ domain-containing protein, partial [bacterium]
LLSGVAAAGPAETAGLKRGDLIIGAAGKKIENLYDYTYALEAMRVGEPTQIRFERDGKQIEIEVVPSSRD